MLRLNHILEKYLHVLLKVKKVTYKRLDLIKMEREVLKLII